MGTPSAIPQAIDALIAVFTTAGVAVIDGGGASDASFPAVVFVGITDPDSTGFDDAATSDQQWAWLGHVQRDETVQIRCLAQAWSGSDDPKAVRDAAFALIGTVSDAITADPTLGNAVLFTEGIEGLMYRSIRTSAGARADIPFTVTCRARLS